MQYENRKCYICKRKDAKYKINGRFYCRKHKDIIIEINKKYGV